MSLQMSSDALLHALTSRKAKGEDVHSMHGGADRNLEADYQLIQMELTETAIGNSSVRRRRTAHELTTKRS